MRRLIVIALLLVALVSAAGCAKPRIDDQTGEVVVTVVDAQTEPLEGASVTITDASDKKTTVDSDSNGVASFESLAEGDYAVAVAMSGYVTTEDAVYVTAGDKQELTVELASEDASGTTDSTVDKAILDSVTSYRWKWTTVSSGETQADTTEGGVEKPDRSYYITRSGSDVTEIYQVGDTVKTRNGPDEDWTTYTGQQAEALSGMGDMFAGMLDGGYSYLEDDTGFKRSDGGSVNGYSTQRYAYLVALDNDSVTTTAWVVDSGEFKGVITRYEWKEVKDGKESSFSWDVMDLNKNLGITLP
jgi:hypothetical protein